MEPGRDIRTEVVGELADDVSVVTHGRPLRHRVLAVGRWCLARPRRAVSLAVLASVSLHLLFISRELGPDEGGFLLVASQWDPATDGSRLYGDLWVDRPPVILLAFRVAHDWGPYGVRLVACVAAAAFVLTAAWAGRVAGGQRAATWSAVIAAALGASALIGAHWLNGELLAAPLVMAAAALAILSTRSGTGPTRLGLAFAAGVLAGTAPLVKQNVVDGLVFAVVLLAASGRWHTLPRRRAGGLLAVCVVGFALPLAAAGAWAYSFASLRDLWFAMYGFRTEAIAVIAYGSWDSSAERLLLLLALALVSGVVYLAAGTVAAQWRALRHRRRRPLALAIGATFAVEVLAVLLGGSYWPHYLVGLLPMLALGGGLAAAGPTRRHLRQRRLILLAAATTLVATPAVAVAMHETHDPERLAGRWLAASAHHDDTALVTYTNPNLLQASGLRTTYPYLWSLPVRTVDPRLQRMRALVRGPAAPTWIVEWDDFGSWGLDPHDRMAGLVDRRYRPVATVCGEPVWLRRGVVRSLAEVPDC